MAINLAAWKKFAKDGAPLFDDPVAIERLLPDPEQVATLVDDAVRTATSRLHHGLRIKGYRQGVLDYRLTNALALTPSGDRGANEWLALVTDDRAACAAFSDLTSWNLDLAAWVQPLLRILLAEGRYDFLSGADVYTFISDSGWTPFGIHKDAEPSMILHLGPEPKEVWVWPKGAIPPESLPRNPSYAQFSFDFDGNLGAADYYLLKPGDFISIPKDFFHVFKNLGPSKFLGFSLYPTEVEEVVTRAFWDVARKDFNASQVITSAEAMAAMIDTSLRDFVSTDSLKAAMRHELYLAELRRKTYGYASYPRRSALPSEAAPRDASFRWAYDGVIAAVGLAAGTELLARGRSVNFTAELDFTELIRMTSSTAAFTRDEVRNLLPGQLSDSGRDVLVESLYRLGALVVCS